MELDHRRTICQTCPAFRHHDARMWCAALDDNHTDWQNCEATKHARWTARITSDAAGCRKWMAPACTIVSALYDIGWRSRQRYLDWLAATLRLRAPIVLFLPEETAEFARQARGGLPTRVIVQTLDQTPYYHFREPVEKILASSAYRDRMADLKRPECFNPLYALIQFAKFAWLARAAEENPFATDYFFWLDAGFSRFWNDFNEPYLGPHAGRLLQSAEDRFVIQFNADENPGVVTADPAYLWDNRSQIQGCMFGGTAAAVHAVAAEVESLFRSMVDAGCVNNEQIALGHLAATKPDLFHVVTTRKEYAIGLFSRLVAPPGPYLSDPCPCCSVVDPLTDPEQQPPPQGWTTDPAVVARHLDAFRELLARDFPSPSELVGDGIVTYGDARVWPMLVVAAKMLRRSGSIVPLQIWRVGPPAGRELDDDPYTMLIDAEAMLARHPARKADSWTRKSYAIAHSGLARVLFLDPDAYAVRDPAPLFAILDECAFAYWADLPWFADRTNYPLTTPLIGGNPWAPPVQGGHFLIDCRRAWRELMLLRWIDNHADWWWRVNGGEDQGGWRLILSATGNYRHIQAADWEQVAFTLRWRGEPYLVHRCQAKLWGSEPPATWEGLPLERDAMEILHRHFPSTVRQPETRDERISRLRRQRRQVLDAAR